MTRGVQQGVNGTIGAAAALKRIFADLPAYHRRKLWLLLVLSILGGLAELATVGAIVPFLAALTARAEEGRLLYITALFIAAAAASGVFRLALAWTSQSFVQDTGHELSTEIQRRVLAQPYQYHVGHNSSEVVASLELVQHLTYGLVQPLLQAAAALVIGLFVIIAVAAINLPIAALATVGFAAIYALIAISLGGPLKRRSTVIAQAYGNRVRLVQESMGAIRDIIIDRSQEAHVDAFREADRRLARARTEAVFTGVAPRYLIETAGLVVLALMALMLGRSAGGLAAALPMIGALALGAQRLLPLAHQVYQGWSLAAANGGIAAKVLGLIELPMPSPDASPPQPLRDRIEVRDVSLTYPGRSEPALGGITFTIEAGSAVALTGPTGSGKSSLVDVLMGLLPPSHGEIRIDGAPMRAAAWQRRLAHVPQSIFLADTSIARNVALGVADVPIDTDRLAAAIGAAELGSFIDTLADGVETVVGERGVRLSGGQRQRIGIARALYKQASILFLDEATSALDEATEARIMTNLAAIPELTIVIVAHRSSTIEHCDQIVRLKGGRLVGP